MRRYQWRNIFKISRFNEVNMSKWAFGPIWRKWPPATEETGRRRGEKKDEKDNLYNV